MLNKPLPSSLKALQGFLGLTGYYRKSVHHYGAIAAPLTYMLKKNPFQWSEEPMKAFHNLKRAMTEAPVLALPDFFKPFIIECDAYGRGIRAVLMQEGRPIAHLSQALKGKTMNLSTYEKELLALVLLVQKWRPYLLGHRFLVRTDQQSFKFLLEQRIGTPNQQRWLSKLLGYDFRVEYRKGKENKAADALSRRIVEEDTREWATEGTIWAPSTPTPTWISSVKAEYSSNPVLQRLKEKFEQGKLDITLYTSHDGMFFYKGQIYITEDSPLRQTILQQLHESPVEDHSGYHKALK